MEHAPPPTGAGLRARVQRFGGHLAGMVMPCIGAFIAWGLIAALFTDGGWVPNESLARLIDPMVLTLLPVLIGYTGGRLVHGNRGAIVGAVATMGVVVGADTPMFLGAMIAGPLAAYILKYIDHLAKRWTRPGFEMLVENFTAGITGAAMALLSMLAIRPVVATLTTAAGDAVGFLVSAKLLPLVSILVEPAKVLFLNNAINHGVLSPLGVDQAADMGKSALFLIETNPGPGLGILLAYLLFGPRSLRASVPGSIVIQFFGGIHEIYFPYVLMKPRLILAAIAGGATGVFVFLLTGAGLVSAPSPGSILSILAVTPKGAHFGVLAGVISAAIVSFVVAGALLGFGRGQHEDNDEASTQHAQAAETTARNKKLGKRQAPEPAESQAHQEEGSRS